MRKLFTTLLFFSVGLYCTAQSNREEIYGNIEVTAGMCYTYHPSTKIPTLAPKGYKPFYITHFGRHGSRYQTWDGPYTSSLKELEKADSAEVLTEIGLALLEKIRIIGEDARARIGDLTELGMDEHRGIAARMYHACPEVFTHRKGRSAVIKAYATQVPRTILSMGAFVQQLTACDAGIKCFMVSSLREQAYLLHQPNADKREQPFFEDVFRFRMSLGNSSDRLMSVLISDPVYVKTELKGGDHLMNSLMQVATIIPTAPHLNISLLDLFTKDELFKFWQGDNYRLYLQCGPSKGYGDQLTADAIPLLTNIVETADNAISTRRENATLRFGHDLNFVPLVSLMNLNGLNVQVDFPEKLYEVWSSYKISPMGTNIQVIFFDNKQEDILVKILLNEGECTLPIGSETAPYYKWSDVKAYWQSQTSYYSRFAAE